MWTERRTPQSVISVATSQARGVDPGDKTTYNHASNTKPRPQQTSAILASRSLTLRIQTRVAAASMVPRPMIAVMVTGMFDRVASGHGDHWLAQGSSGDRAQHASEDQRMHR